MIELGLAGATAACALAWQGRRHALARLLKLPPPANRWRASWHQVPVEPDEGGEPCALATQVLQPPAGGPHPTVLIRTPYGQGWAGGLPGIVNQLYATLLVERGYVVVQQDCRGRFTSSGTFVPFVHERSDGLAALRWIEGQPWFDGRLATFGQSYGGFVQWAIADDPVVKAMVPIQTSAEFHSAMHPDGSVAIEVALRFLSMMQLFGVDGAPGPVRGSWTMLRQTASVRPACAALPITEADLALIGAADAHFRDALLTSAPDEGRWAEVDHRPRRDACSAPALFVTGWLDPFLRETLRDFSAQQAAGCETLLTVGPWPHGAVDGQWISEVIAWLDHTLKGGPPLERAPVRYHLMHADRWEEATSWPPPGEREHTWYLDAEGGLSERRPEGEAEPSRYVFDPAEPTPHLGGPLLDLEGAGFIDNAPLERRDDVLVFTGPPLDEELDLVGSPQVELFCASSEPHTDWFVRLCDVGEKGRSVNVTDAFARVSPPTATEGGLSLTLWPIAWRFRRGHRLRVLVASGAHPRYARNHGTGEPQALAVDMKEQRQQVFHDGARPSRITLPALL